MNDWSGNCSLLETDDFKPRDIFHSHWPISFDELDRYSNKVENFLDLHTRFSEGALTKTSVSSAASFHNTATTSSSSGLNSKLFIRSKVKLPSSHFDSIIKSSHDLRIITGATVGKLTMNKENTAVESITADSLGKKITITSKLVVLASSLENGPILLRSLGEPADIETHPLPALGRYLHSHLLSLRGFFIPHENSDMFNEYSLPGDLGPKGKELVQTFKGLQVSAEQRTKENMLNGVMFLSPVTAEALLIPEEVHPVAKQLLLSQGHSPNQQIFAIRHYIEQIPRWTSLISLGDSKGESALQRPEYWWEIGSEEEHTMASNLVFLSAFMNENKLGSVHFDSCGEENNRAIFGTNAHPMGGTIMGTNSQNSVVNGDCSVHGYSNLFVTGGSVLPRSGAAMLAGVILQLSFRLADHLDKILSKP